MVIISILRYPTLVIVCVRVSMFLSVSGCDEDQKCEKKYVSIYSMLVGIVWVAQTKREKVDSVKDR